MIDFISRVGINAIFPVIQADLQLIDDGQCCFIGNSSVCLAHFFSMGHVTTQELVPSWFKSVSYGVYVLFIQFFGACGPLISGLTKAFLMIQIFTAAAVVVFLLISLVYIKDYEKARALEQEQNYC